MQNVFNVGDLVQMDNQFDLDRHPPMGTYGIVVDVENWEQEMPDGNSENNELLYNVDQFVRVHWAHHKNHDDQCYIDASLKKVSEV